MTEVFDYSWSENVKAGQKSSTRLPDMYVHPLRYRLTIAHNTDRRERCHVAKARQTESSAQLVHWGFCGLLDENAKEENSHPDHEKYDSKAKQATKRS